jgi:hypothetical protein
MNPNFLDGIGAMLFFYLLWYYALYFYGILFKKNRNTLIDKNVALSKLRKKQFKTLEEQKEFLTKKYPYIPFNFSWKIIPLMLWSFAKFVFFFVIFNNILMLLNLRITIFAAIVSWIIFPLIINYILMKYNLEENDFIHFIRWK